MTEEPLTEERLWTVQEVAGYCSVSERTVYRWIADRKLAAFHFGGSTRIQPQDLAAFFEAHYNTPPQPRCIKKGK